jgi:hypothetical protein
MNVFAFSSGLFAMAFAVHIALWRTRVPHHQAKTLAIIFAVVGIVGIALAATEIGPLLSLGRLVLTTMLYCSFVLVYFVLFSAVEAESPTLTMIGLVSHAKSNGIERETLLNLAARGTFAAVRLDQLLQSGLVTSRGDRVFPGREGRLFVDFVLQYRRFIGRTSTGG